MFFNIAYLLAVIGALYVCLYNVWVWMKCSGIDELYGCLCNVWVLMQSFGVYELFWCLCNVQVLMQYSSLDAMLDCWCIVWVLMQYLVVYATFRYWCHAHVLYRIMKLNTCRQWFTQLVNTIVIAASTQFWNCFLLKFYNLISLLPVKQIVWSHNINWRRPFNAE